MSDYLCYQEQISTYLNKAGLKGDGVEIGVYKGDSAAKWLKYWEGKYLFLIDPWRHQSDDYFDLCNNSDEEQEKIYQEVVGRFSPYYMRSQIIREFSHEAVDRFSEESLDFIFIDGNHKFESVLQDVKIWWPKLKSGGVLAGHDYFDGFMPPHTVFGVRTAVDFFAYQVNHKVIPVSFERNHDYCWLMVKDKWLRK